MIRKAASCLAAIMMIAASAAYADNSRVIIMAATATPTTVHLDGHGFMPRGSRSDLPIVLLGSAGGSLRRNENHEAINVPPSSSVNAATRRA